MTAAAGGGVDQDVDHVIAGIAAMHGLDATMMPDTVLAVGTVLLHDAMPLLKAPAFDSYSPWLPVLAAAFVEWARREHQGVDSRAAESNP